jgi:hypothetical protein
VEDVNTALAEAGFKARLVHGRVGGSYFYFDNVLGRAVLSFPITVPQSDPAILVSHVSELTINEWIDALRIAEVEEKTNPRQD